MFLVIYYNEVNFLSIQVQKRFPGLNYYIGNDNFLKLTDNAVIHRECIIESFLNAIGKIHKQIEKFFGKMDKMGFNYAA